MGISNVFYELNIKDLEGKRKAKLFTSPKLFFKLFSFLKLGVRGNIWCFVLISQNKIF